MYFVEKTKTLSPYKTFDYSLFVAVLLLSAIGLLALRSASVGRPGLFNTQVLAFLMGLALCLILTAIDYKDLKFLSLFLYIGVMGLMVLVLFIGKGDELGNKNWINVAGISVQPSEFAKIAYIILAAVFLERIKDNAENKKANIIKFLFYSGIVIGLVLLQKDKGTALVFCFIFILFIFAVGIPYRYLFIMGGLATLSLPFIWVYVLNDNNRERILTFLSPERDPLGSGYNVIRSKIAIGSGQLWGQGLGNGIQTQAGNVPVNESDFIFSVIGEELGFVGGIIVIMLAMFILLKCIHIARTSSDSYGAFIAIGVTGMYAFHFIENIGMSIGLLPVTGIPLPFVSQGGTALMTCFMALGLVMSISLRRKKGIFNSSQ